MKNAAPVIAWSPRKPSCKFPGLKVLLGTTIIFRNWKKSMVPLPGRGAIGKTHIAETETSRCYPALVIALRSVEFGSGSEINPPIAILSFPLGQTQCRKCRIPVNTIASPSRSAIAITSGSFTDPPG
jgi:hypothetical protein